MVAETDLFLHSPLTKEASMKRMLVITTLFLCVALIGSSAMAAERAPLWRAAEAGR